MQADAACWGGGGGGQTGVGPAPDLSPAPQPSPGTSAGAAPAPRSPPEQLQELKGFGVLSSDAVCPYFAIK